ncbi:MAG: IPT/TIG domain-containing protein [Acidimicrobiales bacterium]
MVTKGFRHLRPGPPRTGDAAPSVPDQRALDALAAAVQRARDAAGATPPTRTTGDTGEARPRRPLVRLTDAPATVVPAHGQRDAAPHAPAPEERAPRQADSAPATAPLRTAAPTTPAPITAGPAAPGAPGEHVEWAPEDMPTELGPVLPSPRSPRATEPAAKSTAPVASPAGLALATALAARRAAAGHEQGEAPTHDRPRRPRTVYGHGVLGGVVRRLPLAVLVLALCAVVIALRFTVFTGSGGSASGRHETGATVRPTTQPAHHSPPTVVSTLPPSPSTTLAPTTTAPTTTTRVPVSTTTSTVVAAGAAPTLASVAPAQGSAGTVLLVHGTNFFSPNGLVLAHVGGFPARTVCPAQDVCKVTVPDLAGSRSVVTVTITTEAGTSNAMSFQYT